MAAYCQVYDFSHLAADCPGPGSALEPDILMSIGLPKLPF